MKLSPGGLVDIEFVAQYLQIVGAAAGGPLRQHTAEALAAIAEAGLADPQSVAALEDAWRLQQNLSQLLKVALQEDADPAREPKAFRAALARAGGVRGFASLSARLQGRPEGGATGLRPPDPRRGRRVDLQAAKAPRSPAAGWCSGSTKLTDGALTGFALDLQRRPRASRPATWSAPSPDLCPAGSWNAGFRSARTAWPAGSRSSAEMPMPVSLTLMRTRSPSGSRRFSPLTVIRPPCGVNFTALESRLSSTCLIAR